MWDSMDFSKNQFYKHAYKADLMKNKVLIRKIKKNDKMSFLFFNMSKDHQYDGKS